MTPTPNLAQLVKQMRHDLELGKRALGSENVVMEVRTTDLFRIFDAFDEMRLTLEVIDNNSGHTSRCLTKAEYAYCDAGCEEANAARAVLEKHFPKESGDGEE